MSERSGHARVSGHPAERGPSGPTRRVESGNHERAEWARARVRSSSGAGPERPDPQGRERKR